MSDVINDPKMKSFVESPVSDDFGLTVDEVAEQCKSWGRFNAWLNQDITQIKEVLNAVKNEGVSPSFFASYERTEGYNSSWGWLNHTTQQGNYLNDAKVTAQWIVSQSKNTTDNPAWIDFANYNDFVPASVKQSGNSHFSTLPSGTIGKVVIAGTAAATWEVYYPNGLLAEYNGVQDYGTPITHMIQYIEDWGGSVSGGSGLPDGVQLAQMPFDYMYITQGEWGEYHTIGTHSAGTGQELAMDFIFPTTQYRMYAPFDIELMMQDPNYATNVWKSTTPVMAVDGTIYDALHIIVIHDDFWYTYDVGMTRKQGEYFANSGNATGNYGISTGDHTHIEVMKGHTYQFPPSSSNQLSLYDIFDTSNVTDWIQPRHYDWKEWEGDLPDPDPEPDPDPDPEPDPDPDPPGDPLDSIIQRFISELLTELESRLSVDVHKQGDSDYYKNSFLILQKQLENSYKVRPNLKLIEDITRDIERILRNLL